MVLHVIFWASVLRNLPGPKQAIVIFDGAYLANRGLIFPVPEPTPAYPWVHEIVYFNNREADLEKHAFIRNGRVYITLTDLMRHIGGSIIWGPDDDQMMVYRNGVEVEVFPHRAIVNVNGVEMDLGRTTMRKANRTYVPVRPFVELFGIATDWDFQDDRAYVTYQE